jgi:hypothetical protein
MMIRERDAWSVTEWSNEREEREQKDEVNEKFGTDERDENGSDG